MDANHTPHGRRYTVNEAAEVLGISAEAVRARINRGTLHKEKDADGTVYVRMDVDHTHTDGRTDGDHTAAESLAFQLMQDQIAFLRAELERKDAILLTMAQRIPELEAAPEARERPETATKGVGEDQVAGDPERLPWWKRLFSAPQS